MEDVRLLLILGALQGSLSQIIHVSQIPEINTTSGSTVTLQCNYNLRSNGGSKIIWFTWYRHMLGGPLVCNSCEGFVGRVSTVSQTDFFNKSSANIELQRVVASDTGLYICQVEFQLNGTISGHGNGTILNVQESDPYSYPLIYLAVLGMFLAVIVSVAVYLGSTKKGNVPTRNGNPVVSNNFTAQEPRADEVRSQAIQQLQDTASIPYNVLNHQYIYVGCLEHNAAQNTQTNQAVALYSEIP